MINLLKERIKYIQTNLKDFINGKVFNKEDKLKKLGLIWPTSRTIIIEKDSIILSDPVCPDCSCTDVVKDGNNPKLMPDKKTKVMLKRFRCKRCGRRFTTKFDHTKNKDHHFKAVKVFSSFLRCASAATSIPLRTVKSLLFSFLSYPLSHESVRSFVNSLSEKVRAFINKAGGSGYYCYDEQHVRVMGKRRFRQTVRDTLTFEIINERVVDEITEYTVSSFLIDSLGQKNVISITTDGDVCYPVAIARLENHLKRLGIIRPDSKIKHQRCIFHTERNLTKAINAVKDKDYSKLLTQVRMVFNLDNEEVLKECLSELGNETEEFVRDKLRNSKNTADAARAIFSTIHLLSKNYPRGIRKVIDGINDNWDDLTHFYHDKNISRTTNPLDCYYAYSSGTKRRFKTNTGLENHFTVRAFFRNLFGKTLTLEQIFNDKFLLSLI